MTRNTSSLYRKAITCFAFLIWALAGAGWASESTITNQTAPSGAEPGSLVLTNAEQVHSLTRKQAALSFAAGVVTQQKRGKILTANAAFVFCRFLPRHRRCELREATFSTGEQCSISCVKVQQHCNNMSIESTQVVDSDGADGGGRTHTSVKILDFESSASANSATSAT